jgi:hypothetical protein
MDPRTTLVLHGSLKHGRSFAHPYWLQANIHQASGLFH